MKWSKKCMKGYWNLIEENKILLSIRQGMILAVPAIMIGSFALVLSSLPIAPYQAFINTFGNGILAELFSGINLATMGMISLILLGTISFYYEILSNSKFKGIIPLVCLCSYVAFTVQMNQNKMINIFDSQMLFNTIIITITACVLFHKLSQKIKIHLKSYTYGIDVSFHVVISAILPMCIVVSFFSVLGFFFYKCMPSAESNWAFSAIVDQLFDKLGKSIFSGIIFLFFMHFMWFFGIHGSNMLDDVAKNVFVLNTDTIISKSFFDTFALFGGCGTILCFIIAVFLFEKHSNIKQLAKIAFFPSLFNINELIVFGIPIVYNPIFFIPFITTPLILMTISYFAIYLGFVPQVISSVEWTTPIFLSGYVATNSIAGSILQLINLIIGVLIYIPFVKLSQSLHISCLKKKIELLTEKVKKCEKEGKKPMLLEGDSLSATAKTLVNDMYYAMKSKQMSLFYQPQVYYNGTVYGAEALLRWNHEIGGYLYPPLVIALAEEAGLLEDLGQTLLEQAASDLQILNEKFGNELKISVNLAEEQINNPNIVNEIEELLKKYQFEPQQLGLELTEQIALSSSSIMVDKLKKLRDIGVKILMDDFGMGHSSILYLQNNQFDVVKLDGSLIRELMNNSRSGEIVSSIVNLSNSLNFQVVAEFVETQEQKEVLHQLECEIYQGYLYSPAIPFEKFIDFLESYKN